MVDPIEIVGGAVGYSSGAVYHFGSNLLAAIGSGDFSELLRLMSTLLMILIGYQLSKRVLCIISGTLVMLVKIVSLIVLVTFAIDAYKNGFQSTMKAFTGLTMKLAITSWNAAGPVKKLAAEVKSLSYAEAVKLYDRAETMRRELMQ